MGLPPSDNLGIKKEAGLIASLINVSPNIPIY
jgi:hypothetical protein